MKELNSKSIWQFHAEATQYPCLQSDLDVDVAIIGGGITGISAAQILAKQGLSVAVLEMANIGQSSTGHSTGNLYPAVSEILLEVNDRFGTEITKAIVDSRVMAIRYMEDNIKTHQIDCDFISTTWNYYSTLASNLVKIDKAYESARAIGLEVEYGNFPFFPKAIKGIRLNGSAQLNPLLYVQGIATAIRDQCQIFENTKVEEIHESAESVEIITAEGCKVKSSYLIHASHTPKGITLFHTVLEAHREYGIAGKIESDHPEGIYFGYYSASDVTSSRVYERNAQKYLICVGGPHKVGHGDGIDQLNSLEQCAYEHFGLKEITHRWGAQNYKSADFVPYIGPKTQNSNIYIATGFSSHGLVYGTVAAMVMSDLITKKKNPFAAIYKPSRFNPLKSAEKVLKANTDVFGQLVKDYLFTNNGGPFSAVPIGQAKVVNHEGHKLAVFREDEESFKICSAICTHLGCIVHWNGVESSWDCPCHGSRFDTDGQVIEGPALKPLAGLEQVVGTKNEAYAAREDTPEDIKRTDQQHVMTDDERIDEAIAESFPASDPPGHR